MSFNDRILKAIRREPVDATPIWFMRQAGRVLPRYRESRAMRDMISILNDPEAAAEITAMPLDYFPVDAAVLYNDLVTPFIAAGLQLEMRPGIGPVVLDPVMEAHDVERMKPFDPRVELKYSMDQIKLLVKRINVPVLGFVGAPFTLCSYLIRGSRSKHQEEIKEFMLREPDAWHTLATFWADHLAEFGIAQHEAGAGAVQVFDSWAGSLSPEDYEAQVLPYSHRMIARMRSQGVPVVHFATGNPALLPLISQAGGDCISVDWRLPIDSAWDIIGEDKAIQGNIDPTALLAGKDVALRKAKDIMERIAGRPGHIFNSGHGLLPGTDPDVIKAVVDFVHEYR
ncbi:MAG TPA: uroporphyrinogen decarboxylase [Longimicrobiales bacterium]|nr:uroporphyrinogen decarboxylase [Longimicrobiales bacterium]